MAFSTDAPFSKTKNELTLTNLKDQELYVHVLQKGILAVGTEKTLQRGFEVKQTFLAKDQKTPMTIEKIKQGTDFLIDIKLTNTTDKAVKDIALTQILPSGWEVVNTRFTEKGRGGASASSPVDHTDIRDDRVHFYFDLKGRSSARFKLLVNASYLGKYYLPGLQAEAMYDADYLVRNKGKWVEVVE